MERAEDYLSSMLEAGIVLSLEVSYLCQTPNFTHKPKLWGAGFSLRSSSGNVVISGPAWVHLGEQQCAGCKHQRLHPSRSPGQFARWGTRSLWNCRSAEGQQSIAPAPSFHFMFSECTSLLSCWGCCIYFSSFIQCVLSHEWHFTGCKFGGVAVPNSRPLWRGLLKPSGRRSHHRKDLLLLLTLSPMLPAPLWSLPPARRRKRRQPTAASHKISLVDWQDCPEVWRPFMWLWRSCANINGTFRS